MLKILNLRFTASGENYEKASTIVVNWNGKEVLQKCSDSEVMVVDNGGMDGRQDMIKEKFEWIRLIENSPNRQIILEK